MNIVPGEMRMGLGIVGCGYWGPNLARVLDSLRGTRVRALCDLRGERLARLQALHPAAVCHEDFRRVLELPEVTAVVIATPTRSHSWIAREALLAGKHVLVEKPMAGSSAECEELIELAEARNLVLMVGHTYLYSEPVAKIIDIIRGGEIGEVRYVNCQRLNLGIFQNDLNVAWDLAPHDLSILLHVMGELPLMVNCQGNAHIHPDVEDVTNLSLTFSGKRFATVQSSWLEPRKVRQMTFVGTRKMIVYDDLQPLEKIRIYDVGVDLPPDYASFAEFQYAYHYGDCHIPHVDQREPLVAMCEHFVSCIQSGRRPATCGLQGLAVVRVLEACQASLAARGAPVVVAQPARPGLAVLADRLPRAV